jgi:hypothetical protein
MSLPLADAPALRRAARRTSLVAAGLAAGVVGCVAASVAAAPGAPAPTEAAAAPGRTTEVVLDLSGSVADVSNPQILRGLRRIAATSSRVGLVVFSDAAEEVLPPGTPARELRYVFRYFEPLRPHEYGPTPWSLRFTGGTTISAGLRLARRALDRDGVRGSVVLISDAADNVADRRALREQLVALARDGRQFHLMRLVGGTAGDVAVYRGIYGTSAVSTVPRTVAAAPTAARRAHLAFPVWPCVLALLAAALVAARELFAVSMRWRAT